MLFWPGHPLDFPITWVLLVDTNSLGGPLLTNRVWKSVFAPRRSAGCVAVNFHVHWLSIVAALCVLGPQMAHSQKVETLVDANATAELNTPAKMNTLAEALTPPGADAATGSETQGGNWFKRPVESEIIVEGMASYGNYKIFASGYDDKLYTAGVEYDRHSWGQFLGAQMDYVAEVLPFVLLNKPVYTDQWGNPLYSKGRAREYVPGLEIAPIGFRWQWRSKKAIKPYLEAKGGMIGFTKKVPATQASYESFTLQSAMGVQVKMNERWGLRLGLFNDFHFSNAFVVPSNPGLDVMNSSLGLSYHFGFGK